MRACAWRLRLIGMCSTAPALMTRQLSSFDTPPSRFDSPRAYVACCGVVRCCLVRACAVLCFVASAFDSPRA
nr:MAG TPA: hypothetical protein [Caudoviricetes sp.]